MTLLGENKTYHKIKYQYFLDLHIFILILFYYFIIINMRKH